MGQKSVLKNKRYACLFDGIIYNSEQIHALLENQGHSINDKDCAQLMMYSFSQWKEDCVYKIKGVFQAVVWDNEEKSLFIVCDRMGQKPFYYAQRGNLLAFASHYNMLLRYCGVEPVIDGTSIAEIIGLYPFKTSEFGMIKDVYKLRPAHYIKWSGGEVKIRRYWSIENRPHTDNLAITAQKVKFLVKDSVIQNVKHEENICSLLSGG